MTDSAMNVPLLRKVYEQISEHPEGWYQGEWRLDIDGLREHLALSPKDADWRWREVLADVLSANKCGTVYCFAGWACAINGDEFESDSFEKGWVKIDGGDDIQSIAGRAEDILGLTSREGNVLFNQGNSMDRIKKLLTDWGVLDD